jgi:FAD/FMN-containing dehydrogenase
MITLMKELKEKLQNIGFKGELDDSTEAKEFYSHDASMFEIIPEVIAKPTSADDVTRLVKFVSDNKKSNPDLSLTARSAGTDMSGAAINDSIIVDFNAQ